MKCMEREELFAYLHRLLELREEGSVRAHVTECASCRGILEEYRSLDAALEDWKTVEPSPWFDARLRAAVQSGEVTQPGWSWFGLGRLRWAVPAVAVVLVLVTSVLILRTRQVRHASQHMLSQVARKAGAPAAGMGAAQAAGEPAEEELSLYQNLPVLEDYDLLANFEVLSELPKSEKQVEN